MKKYLILLAVTVFYYTVSWSQPRQYEYALDAEYGVTIGVAHYFGDLNNQMRMNRFKPVIGAFFRKQFNDYVAARISGHFAQVGYSDRYNKTEFEQLRNLSFNSNIFELAIQGDFNFFRFIPTDPNYAFTPYASVGIGIFSYNPYAFLEGKKYYLRPLNTEGQTFYENRKAYGSTAVCFPLSFGVKYALSDRINISAELGYRFTTTDYLDDVSTTYVGIEKFPGGHGNVAGKLQDRSYELTTVPIGIEGRQRGFSKQKDQYMFIEAGISFNLINYNCPTAR